MNRAAKLITLTFRNVQLFTGAYSEVGTVFKASRRTVVAGGYDDVVLDDDRAKVAAHPLCGVLGGNGSILPAPDVNIISQVQEVGKPELLRANITDVRYPDLPHAVFVSGGHLLPHFGQVGGTHPFK